MELLDEKQQSNLHTQGDLVVSKLSVWVLCMGITHFYPILVILTTSSRHRRHHQLSEDVGATK